jgi:hypothetical protein
MFPLANPEASPAAGALLTRLHNLRGHSTLSAQHDYISSGTRDLVKLAYGRLVALGEVGHLPDPDLLRTQPLWSWVMPWGGLVFRFNSDEKILDLYQHLDPHL